MRKEVLKIGALSITNDDKQFIANAIGSCGSTDHPYPTMDNINLFSFDYALRIMQKSVSKIKQILDSDFIQEKISRDSLIDSEIQSKNILKFLLEIKEYNKISFTFGEKLFIEKIENGSITVKDIEDTEKWIILHLTKKEFIEKNGNTFNITQKYKDYYELRKTYFMSK